MYNIIRITKSENEDGRKFVPIVASFEDFDSAFDCFKKTIKQVSASNDYDFTTIDVSMEKLYGWFSDSFTGIEVIVCMECPQEN